MTLEQTYPSNSNGPLADAKHTSVSSDTFVDHLYALYEAAISIHSRLSVFGYEPVLKGKRSRNVHMSVTAPQQHAHLKSLTRSFRRRQISSTYHLL